MAKKEEQLFQIDLTYYPIYSVIPRYLILDYLIVSQPDKLIQALYTDIPPGFPLHVMKFHRIGHVTFAHPIQNLLVLGQ